MFFYLTYMNELDKMQSVITKKFIINLPNFVLIKHKLNLRHNLTAIIRCFWIVSCYSIEKKSPLNSFWFF